MLLVGLMPHSRLKSFLLGNFGWHIHKSAHVAPAIFWKLPSVILCSDVRIGLMSVYRNTKLNFEVGALIGSWNWITSIPVNENNDPIHATLALGTQSAITSRHYLDCSGGLVVGDFATVAGVRNVIFTHQIDVSLNRQSRSSVKIGAYALVNSGVQIAPGVILGEGVLIAMGSVLPRKEYSSHRMYGGNPAVFIREQSGKYFQRSEGAVGEDDGH